jgi:DNA-binding beta-propeller fold protein YncE
MVNITVGIPTNFFILKSKKVMNSTIRKLIIITTLLGFIGQAQAGVKVYVPLGSANEIVVIDGDRDEVIGHIGDVTNAHGLAATPDGNYLVAGSMSLAPKDQKIPDGMTEDEHNAHHVKPVGEVTETGNGASFVSMIDVKTMRVVQRFEVDGITHHSAITPDGRYVVSTHTTTGNISIIDLIDRKLVKTISTGPVPNYPLISADGKFIYVSNSGNNTVSEIETEQWVLRRSFDVGSTPEHMVFSSDQKIIYVVNVGDDTVSRVSLLDAKVTKVYPVDKGPHGIAISDNNRTLFVSSKSGNQLDTIDLASGNTNNIKLDPKPYHIASIPGTGKLYVSSRAKPWIWVLNQNSLEVLRKIPIKGEGHQMVVQQ